MPMLRGLEQISLLPGTTTIRHLDWSPGGSEIAVASRKGSVRIWDWVEERPKADLSPLQPVDLKQVSWSPGGELIAACGETTIDLWEPLQPRHLERRELPGRLLSAAWSAEGRALGLALLEGPAAPRLTLSTWSLDSGDLCRLHGDSGWEDSYYGLSCDRRWLALARTDGRLELWDLRSLQRVQVIDCDYRDVGAVAVSPEQGILAVSFGGEVDLRNLINGEPIPPLGDDRARIYSLAFSHDGKILAGKSRNGTVRLWWCEDWHESTSIEEPSVGNQQAEIAFHPHAPRLVTYERRNTSLRIWELDLEQIGRTPMRKRRVLLLSADLDAGLPPLQTGFEFRLIREKLNLGVYRDEFEVHVETAVRAEDIQRALQQFKPEIVHFAGHGNDHGSIFVSRHNGTASEMSQAVLADLFALVSNTVRCVVLNACHSENQARSISKVINHVIGMSSSIADRSAIEFSTGFYQALGNGEMIKVAYHYGCLLVDRSRLPGPEIPVLFEQGEALPKSFIPVQHGSRHGLGAFVEEPGRLVEELRQFRDRAMRTKIERLLAIQGGGDYPRLAHVIASEVFARSACRDVQITSTMDGMGSEQRLLKRIEARLRTEGLSGVGADQRGVLANLLAEVSDLRRRLQATGRLTFSMPGARFDPLLHEPYSGVSGDEADRVVELSLFPSYRVNDSVLLKELVLLAWQKKPGASLLEPALRALEDLLQ